MGIGAMTVTKRYATLAMLLCGALAAGGCAAFKPQPLDEAPFKGRAKTEERDGIRVTVSVPTREEAKRAFSVDLEKEQIQPVWIRIENDTDTLFWFMLHGLDPNYYSAAEAAYICHYPFPFGWSANRKMDEYFGEQSIEQRIPSTAAPRDSPSAISSWGQKRCVSDFLAPARCGTSSST